MTTLREVPNMWRSRTPFNANGTLQGHEGSVYQLGRLPQEWQEKYRADRDSTVYTVTSYATPIAWVLTDGTEVKPPVKYSVTTSKHQGKLY